MKDKDDRKIPTVYDDYYTPFVRWLIENTPEFEHLRRPRIKWQMPKGVGRSVNRFKPRTTGYGRSNNDASRHRRNNGRDNRQGFNGKNGRSGPYRTTNDRRGINEISKRNNKR